MASKMRRLLAVALFAALCAMLLSEPASALASRASSTVLKHQHHAAKRVSTHAHAHEQSKASARGPADDADEDYEDDEDDDDGNGSEYDDNPPRFDESKFYNGREVFRRRKNAFWRRRRVLPTIYSSASVPPQAPCQCGGMPVRCGSPCHRRRYVKAPYTYVSPLSNTPAAQSVSDGKNVFTRYNGVYASTADVPSSSYVPSPAASPSFPSSSSGDNPYSYFGRDYFADWGHIGSYLYKSAEERRKEMLERLGPKPRISDALRHVDQLNHHYVRRQRLHDIWAYMKKHENDHFDYEELAEDTAPTTTSCSAPSCPSLSVSGCQEESCNRNDENYR